MRREPYSFNRRSSARQSSRQELTFEPAALIAPCRCGDSRCVFSTRFFHEDDLPADLRPSLQLLGRVCGGCGSDRRPAGVVGIEMFDGSDEPGLLAGVCSRCADLLSGPKIQQRVAERFFACVEFLGAGGGRA
jgi:hypothetical protein